MEANAFLSKEESKPLNTCKECKDQPCIKTGNICKEVEKILSAREIRGYSPRQIRNKERQFPTEVLERIAAERAFKLKFGKEINKHYSNKIRDERDKTGDRVWFGIVLTNS